MEMSVKKIVGSIVVGFVLILTLVFAIASIEVIPQGHVGIVFNSINGGVQDGTLGQGLHFVGPWSNVTEFSVAVETVDVIGFNVLTRDGKSLGMSLSYDYSIDLAYVSDVFQMFRGQRMSVIEAGWLEDRALRASLNVFSRYSVMDVFQNLARIQQDVFEEFRSIVSDYGFNVSALTLHAPTLDDETSRMVQQIVDAQMQIEQLELVRLQAIIEADTLIEEARGIAESQLIQARGEAEANEILLQTLSPEILQQMWIEAWNGVLPSVVSENSELLLSLSDLN